MSKIFINFTYGTVLETINFYTLNYVYTLQYRHTSDTISVPSGDMDYRQNSQTNNQVRIASC